MAIPKAILNLQESNFNAVMWSLASTLSAEQNEIVDALKFWNSICRQIVEPFGKLQIFPSFSINLREVLVNVAITYQLQFGRLPLTKTHHQHERENQIKK